MSCVHPNFYAGKPRSLHALSRKPSVSQNLNSAELKRQEPQNTQRRFCACGAERFVAFCKRNII